MTFHTKFRNNNHVVITETREQWIALLEAASQSPESVSEEDWKWLMQRLGITSTYFPAVRMALEQGRWRNARNPRAYLKTVAGREAKKMGLDQDMVKDQITVPRQMTYEEALEHAAFATGTSTAIKGFDGVWRRGEGWDDFDYDNPRNDFECVHDFLVSQLPDDLKIVEQPSEELQAEVEAINNKTQDFHIHLGDIVEPDWQRWADAAGFDPWEKLVLDCRRMGKSRDRALAEQPDEQSRKALQAAWRQFDRTGMARLRNASKKSSS